MRTGATMLVAAVLVWPGCAQTGLNNSTRAFTDPATISPSDWSDPEEMERTWQAALVRVPKPGGGYVATTVAELRDGAVSPLGVWPTVVYMHGCSGFWSGTRTRINFLAGNGYAVVAPASFARLKYPRSCRTETHRGGLYRRILRMRQSDVGHAVSRVKALPWVDKSNVFLMGLSEGGITTATFSSSLPEHSLRARVVEGWTCHSGWAEYRGVNAPESEPVLTLVGAGDPWFQDRWTRGACDPFLDKANGSRSVVYSKGPLRVRHELLEAPEARREVLDFLSRNLSR